MAEARKLTEQDQRGRCSCGAKIIWARHPTKGTPIPLVAHRVMLYDLEDNNSGKAVQIGTGYVSHFLNCPHWNRHSGSNKR